MVLRIELPLAIARDIKKLYLEISKFAPKATIAEFLLSNQELKIRCSKSFNM